MNLNQTMYYVIKILLVVLYAYTFMKFKRAKSLDHTLKLKLKARSMIEFYGSIILSVGFIAYSAQKEVMGFAVFIGAIIFLISYLVLERLVAVGRKVIYAKFFAFEVNKINKCFYKKGTFDFYIRGGNVKVFLPVTDMDYVTEMLSGRRQRGRGRRN